MEYICFSTKDSTMFTNVFYVWGDGRVEKACSTCSGKHYKYRPTWPKKNSSNKTPAVYQDVYIMK